MAAPGQVERDRHLVHARAELLERRGGLAHERVDVCLRVRVAEAFLHDGDLHAARVARQRVRAGGGLDVHLARIEAVGPGQHLEQPRVVGHRRRHGARVIERHLDGEDAGVGDEAVRGLQSVHATVGSRDADRATLVAADGHLDLAAATTAALPEDEPPAE